jgi:hypothetical protein
MTRSPFSNHIHKKHAPFSSPLVPEQRSWEYPSWEPANRKRESHHTLVTHNLLKSIQEYGGEKKYGQQRWAKDGQRAYHDHKFVSATEEVELYGKSREKERDIPAALVVTNSHLTLPHPPNPNFWTLTESHLFYYTRSDFWPSCPAPGLQPTLNVIKCTFQLNFVTRMR